MVADGSPNRIVSVILTSDILRRYRRALGLKEQNELEDALGKQAGTDGEVKNDGEASSDKER